MRRSVIYSLTIATAVLLAVGLGVYGLRGATGPVSLPACPSTAVPAGTSSICIRTPNPPDRSDRQATQPAPTPAPASCQVTTDEGRVIQVPAQACDRSPTIVAGSCQITTDEGRTIQLPAEACAHGPRPGPAPPTPTQPAPGTSCQVTNDQGQTVQLPDEACSHGPTIVAGICEVLTPNGLAIQVPTEACARGPSVRGGPR